MPELKNPLLNFIAGRRRNQPFCSSNLCGLSRANEPECDCSMYQDEYSQDEYIGCVHSNVLHRISIAFRNQDRRTILYKPRNPEIQEQQNSRNAVKE
jgi:hypothetical protein